MTRRARLTLISVLLAAILATATSAVFLRNQIDRQFAGVFDRSEMLNRLAADAVARSLDEYSELPPAEALVKDEDIADRLMKFVSTSSSLLAVVVTDPGGIVLLSTDQTYKRGEPFPPMPPYLPLAKEGTTFDRTRVLFFESKPVYYQLVQTLEVENEGPIVAVRVVVYPGLIRSDIEPYLRTAAQWSVLFIAGAVVLALLYASYVFKPLGRVAAMLDQLARGEYERSGAPLEERGRKDEFGAVLSNVGLLGQRLGNIERLLVQLEEAVLVFGPEGKVVVASGALDEFLGLRSQEMIGRSMSELFPKEGPVGFVLEQVLESRQGVRNLRVPLQASAGGQEEDGKSALLSAEIPEKGGLLVRFRDPEARRQIQGQLQTAERLSAINRVTKGVAHEVKNPLNAIRMHVELARMKLRKGDTEVEPQMEIIGKEIERLDRVVKTFLDFTKPAEVRMSEIAVDDLVSELAELTCPQANAANVLVRLDLGAAGVTIGADADLLKQALVNVAMNAIEAMPKGGELGLATRVDGEEVEVRISDTGVGIPPDRREKIFQLYYTTKPAGSGIGLALTFRMVQLHGGKIDFLSEPGKGTTFILRFPAAHGAAGTAAAARAAAVSEEVRASDL